MTRYLLLMAVLLAGCEQLKSPQRIRELEDRVDKLSSEVATLKGSGSASTPGEHAGSGSADGSGAGSAETVAAAGSGSAGSGSGGSESESGSGSGSAEVAAAGDAGVPDAGAGSDRSPDKADRALAELKAVVARSTQPGKPGAPSALAAAPLSPVPSGLPQWTYDGRTGSPTWGTLDPAWRTCLMGKAQSPIDIEPKAGNASPIVFHYTPTQATPFDDGHTLQVDLSPGSTIEVDGTLYQLLRFHFHMPSEHTIAGEHYPLEVHLVHQDGDGKIAVIAVLYDTGAESRALAALWSRWPHKPGEDRPRRPGDERSKKLFDPSDLLPDTRTVFRYTGSLTTPPCTEGVQWNVMRRAMSDSKANLEGFARHYAHNARELQALNGRKIE